MSENLFERLEERSLMSVAVDPLAGALVPAATAPTAILQPMVPSMHNRSGAYLPGHYVGSAVSNNGAYTIDLTITKQQKGVFTGVMKASTWGQTATSVVTGVLGVGGAFTGTYVTPNGSTVYVSGQVGQSGTRLSGSYYARRHRATVESGTFVMHKATVTTGVYLPGDYVGSAVTSTGAGYALELLITKQQQGVLTGAITAMAGADRYTVPVAASVGSGGTFTGTYATPNGGTVYVNGLVDQNGTRLSGSYYARLHGATVESGTFLMYKQS